MTQDSLRVFTVDTKGRDRMYLPSGHPRPYRHGQTLRFKDSIVQGSKWIQAAIEAGTLVEYTGEETKETTQSRQSKNKETSSTKPKSTTTRTRKKQEEKASTQKQEKEENKDEKKEESKSEEKTASTTPSSEEKDETKEENNTPVDIAKELKLGDNETDSNE